jgi:hypothetical protein
MNRLFYYWGLFLFINIIPVGMLGERVLPWSSQLFGWLFSNQYQLEDQSVSPYWEPEIQLKAAEIEDLSNEFGIHPDLIAAVMWQDMNMAAFNAARRERAGNPIEIADGSIIWGFSPLHISSASSENFHWKMTILAYVMRQTGGDLATALAVYYSGWNHLNDPVPREFADRVLDDFERAILLKQGLPPEQSTHWILHLEVRSGHVPGDNPLSITSNTLTGRQSNVRLLIYSTIGEDDRPFHLWGYVIPRELKESRSDVVDANAADQLEMQLRARLGDKEAAKTGANLRVLIACLPTMNRLQGQRTTRWYQPTSCPPITRE